MTSRPARAWLDLLLLTGCWASGFTFTAMALEGFAPEWVVVFRQLSGAALLILVAAAIGKLRRVPAHLWLWLVVLAVCGNVAPFYAISWGQQHVESGTASILVGTMPLMTLAMAHLLVSGEHMTPRRAAGFAVGFLGVVLMIGPGAVLNMGGAGLALLAQLSVLLGAVFFAANAIIARRMPGMDLWMRAVLTNALSFAIAIPPALLLSPLPDELPGMRAIAGVVLTGAFASGMAAVIYFRLIDQAGPAFMSLTNYLVPPVALIAGIVVLGERPGLDALAGLAFILVGIAIAEWRRRKPQPGR